MDLKLEILFVAIFTVWTVQVSGNNIKTLYTNGYSYNQYFTLEENMGLDKSLRFSVRATKDAYILLAPSHQPGGPVYEIVLGADNNKVNYIRGRCPCQEGPNAIIRTVNVLSQKEFRNFWIKIKTLFRKTLIQVGMGGEATPFLEWHDPKPLNPQYLSFRSESVADWKYGYLDGNYTTGVSADKRKSVVTSTGYGQYFPLSEVVSHSDDAVTLYFSIRLSKQFQILFSSAVNSSGDIYEFDLHEKGVDLRRRHLGEPVANFQQDGFLNKRNRFEFYIKLTKDGQIVLGKHDLLGPTLQWRDPNPISPQFVSFSIYRSKDNDYKDNASSNFFYGLGLDYKISSRDCTPRWKEFTGQLPLGAFRGGHNNEGELFVCRAMHDGHFLPGSYVPGKNHAGGCQVISGLVVYQKTEFQVLTGCRFSWIPESLGAVPEGAIAADETNGNSTKLYVSRVTHEGQVIIGKLQPEDRITYIAFNNQRLPFTRYEVLRRRH